MSFQTLQMAKKVMEANKIFESFDISDVKVIDEDDKLEISGSDGVIFTYDKSSRDGKVFACPEIWYNPKDKTLFMEAINTLISMHFICAYCANELDHCFVCKDCYVNYAPHVYNYIHIKLSK